MPRTLLQGFFLAVQAQESMPAGTILSFDKKLLVSLGIQWVNILLLTAVLIFILYKPVKKFMAERTERIKNEIEAARAEREEAFELKEKYERLIAEIEKERDDILLQAHKKSMEKSDQMLFDARREVEAMHNRALADLEVERMNVIDEMKRQIAEISMLVAGRFVEASISRETQDKYIEEAFTDWECN